VTPMPGESPRLLVLSSLFPSAAMPAAGVFIRERMFRVGRVLPIVVVAPQPWFPLQGLVRRFRPHFRVPSEPFERMDGVEVHRPRFLCIPGVMKWSDGLFMALSVLSTVRRIVRRHRIDLLDVHFGYPEGFAGALLGRWLGLPVMLTLRGKEQRQALTDVRRALAWAVRAADRVITVSDALRGVAIELGADPARVDVVGNGIDLDKFHPLAQAEARARLALPADAQVMVSVGTLTERKGFHRVIDCLPELLKRHPRLHYLVVGGAGPEGDWSERLRAQVDRHGLADRVHFLGRCAPEDLKRPLSAADLFVLATSYEGWANVFLEAMACGLPVVTTRVGGNEQVVKSDDLGLLVPFGDQAALTGAIDDALTRRWDRGRIIQYAQDNAWDRRIPRLVEAFRELHARREAGAAAPSARGAG
jgi:teichuronic acid biosynthesis glycosyltransferase TuaC